jgi:hypothetical protein
VGSAGHLEDVGEDVVARIIIDDLGTPSRKSPKEANRVSCAGIVVLNADLKFEVIPRYEK